MQTPNVQLTTLFQPHCGDSAKPSQNSYRLQSVLPWPLTTQTTSSIAFVEELERQSLGGSYPRTIPLLPHGKGLGLASCLLLSSRLGPEIATLTFLP